MFQAKVVEKIRIHILCSILFFSPPPKIVAFMRYVEKQNRFTDDKITWYMPNVCWIIKATDTHSEHVILTDLYLKKNQLFALKYTLKHSLIKIISTPSCFGLIRPSSGSCAWLLSYLEQITFVLGWLCSSMQQYKTSSRNRHVNNGRGT